MKNYASAGTRIIAVIIIAVCLAGAVLAMPRLSEPPYYRDAIDPDKRINVGDLNISYDSLTALSSQAKSLKNSEDSIEKLPKVGSMTELLKMFDEMGLFYEPRRETRAFNEEAMDIVEDGEALAGQGSSAAPPVAAPMATNTPASAAQDALVSVDGHSVTNTQTSGVDEGDIIKTDGDYIYYAGNGRIAIVKADGADLKRESLIKFDENISFIEMYVKDDYLVAVVNRYETEASGTGAAPVPEMGRIVVDMAWNFGKSFTSFIVYDISDKSAPKEVRRVEAEGGSLSTRMIENTIYFVTNKWINAIPYRDMEPVEILPAYLDSVSGDDIISIEPDDIAYCPGRLEPTYMLVGAFNIDDFEPCTPEAFLGSGNTIYMSKDSLYIIRPMWEDAKNEITAYRFKVDGRNIEFVKSGKVSGQILNQYSMDEYGGYFRIATTEWTKEGNQNNVYILDNTDMEIKGSLTGLAKGESIQSVRFMGDTGYVVTFEQTDPLFVIDLKDPERPEVLGELKIPGFSQYLHPFGDGILIGIGRHTQEMFVRDENGIETVVGVRDAGVKLSMFDVSDPANPKEIHKLIIGTASTSTEVSYNPKALMADFNKGILAMPMQDYSEKQFTGAAIISADKVSGIKLVTRLDAGDERGEFSWQTRLCYIGDTLYMASSDKITAYSYLSYNKIGTSFNAFK